MRWNIPGVWRSPRAEAPSGPEKFITGIRKEYPLLQATAYPPTRRRFPPFFYFSFFLSLNIERLGRRIKRRMVS